MSKEDFSHKLNATMSAGFLKILIGKLADEARPFDMSVRRIIRGVWEIDLYTNEPDYQYFKNLLDSLV